MEDSPEDLLSIKQVADRLNVKASTVRARVLSGELPFIRIGRYIRVRRGDVETFIRANFQKFESPPDPPPPEQS